MFYELSTFDILGKTPWKRSQEGSINGTFEATVNALAQIAFLAEPDATLAEAQRMQNSSGTEISPILKEPSATTGESEKLSISDVEVPNFLPNGLVSKHPNVQPESNKSHN